MVLLFCELTIFCGSVSSVSSAHALEGYSGHFVCLSVADLEDGRLLVLLRDMNLKST